MTRAGLALLAALALALALDVGVAATGGYLLRMEPWRLLAVDALLLSLVVLPALAALRIAARMRGLGAVARRVPRATLLAAAWLPVVVLRAPRAGGALEAAPHAAALAVLALVLVVEWRRRGGAPGAGAALVGVGAGAVAVALLVLVPVPGRELLAPPPAEGEPATAERPNLVFVVLDTTRADHLGLYGYPRPTSPWLDAFAARATVFDHAVSSSSWTLPAHATLFTGLFPRAHGADVVEDGVGHAVTSVAELGRLEDSARVAALPPAAVTLAELAAAAGMETGAICANSAYLYRHFGLDQGFRTYVDPPGSRPAQRPAGLGLGLRLGLDRFWGFRRLVEGNERYYLLASEVNRLALDWLAPRRARRFFLFLNYMDAHEPHIPIGRYRRLFPDADRPIEVDKRAIRERERGILPAERAPLVDAYDAGVRFVDDHLAALFARLEGWGLLDRTVVVVVGDHGESFGEHHEIGHANNVYASEVRVPLVLRTPNQREGTRIHRIVHLVDVMPTLTALLGLETPPGVQGASLFGAGTTYPLVVYNGRYLDLVRSHPRWYDRTHWALYRDPWKLIWRSDGEVELYDVRRDPAEAQNLVGEDGLVVPALRAELRAFEDRVRPLFATAAQGPSEEAEQRLRALGYLP